MPDPTFDPTRQRWGYYPFTTKPALTVGTTGDEVRYLQGALNTLIGVRLTIDGLYGPKTQAAVDTYRRLHGMATGSVDLATWDILDDEAFNLWTQAKPRPRLPLPGGVAINSQGCNRHTGQPVDVRGLTRDTDRLRNAILVAFPGSPTKNNYAVDRAIRGSTALSDHGRGEALDFMLAGFDGNKGNISAVDKRYGHELLEWVVAHAYGPLQVGLRGKTYRGPWRISYALCDGLIYYASENVIRPLKPSSDQHRDHVHISIVPKDRR